MDGDRRSLEDRNHGLTGRFNMEREAGSIV
jgi:hypothetical protein